MKILPKLYVLTRMNGSNCASYSPLFTALHGMHAKMAV